MLANQKKTFSPKKISMVRIFVFIWRAKYFFLIAEKHAKPTKLKKHSRGKNHFNAAIWFQLKDFSIVPILRICIVDASH